MRTIQIGLFGLFLALGLAACGDDDGDTNDNNANQNLNDNVNTNDNDNVNTNDNTNDNTNTNTNTNPDPTLVDMAGLYQLTLFQIDGETLTRTPANIDGSMAMIRGTMSLDATDATTALGDIRMGVVVDGVLENGMMNLQNITLEPAANKCVFESPDGGGVYLYTYDATVLALEWDENDVRNQGNDGPEAIEFTRFTPVQHEAVGVFDFTSITLDPPGAGAPYTLDNTCGVHPEGYGTMSGTIELTDFGFFEQTMFIGVYEVYSCDASPMYEETQQIIGFYDIDTASDKLELWLISVPTDGASGLGESIDYTINGDVFTLDITEIRGDMGGDVPIQAVLTKQ